MKLASSRLIVRDLKQTLAFYIDSLGFTLVAAFPDRDAPAWATVVHEESDIDRFTLMFLDQNAIDPESYVYRPDFEKMERGAGINFYFDIVGVDPLYLRLKKKGSTARFVHDIETMPYGVREFTVLDPDGYQLTFCEAIPVDMCLSCGMPLTKLEQRGAQKKENPYCCYCTDKQGNLLSRQEVERKMTEYMIKNGAPAEEARELAREVMGAQPAWKA